ncbi:unnamed protein product [Urochloa decumbens]|uniref:Uncharacterized protein n=2 Tax=Urochloa decumbens TaxID=240449 RepID=A0ABC9DF88_9POAL
MSWQWQGPRGRRPGTPPHQATHHGTTACSKKRQWFRRFSANGKPALRSTPQDRLLPITMVNSASAAGFINLCAGFMALEIFFFLHPQSGAARAGTTPPSAQAPPLDSTAVELWLPLAAAGTLLTSVAFIYHHLIMSRAAAANRRLSEVVIFLLCVSVGVLDIFFFVAQPADGVDRGAQARALGHGALRALPTAAAANFFWGIMLIIVAHVRAGGEGGGGAVAGAGFFGAIQGGMCIRVLTKIALGAAAGLVFLAIVAFAIKY